MRASRRVLAVVCTGIAFAGGDPTRAQEATSANLSDQFQNGEMTSHFKSKKKKAEVNPQTLTTAPKQNIAPTPEATAPVEELSPVLTIEEKKIEPTQAVEPQISDSTSQHLTKSAAALEKPMTAVAPAERKPRSKKRLRPPAQSEVTSVPAPVPMSLSVAQSMAISAPLPDYPYEAKRRNLSGSGVCVVTVDSTTGRVNSATMSQSTGSRFLDKFTTQTFKNWRFKPGTVSQLRIPITYE